MPDVLSKNRSDPPCLTFEVELNRELIYTSCIFSSPEPLARKIVGAHPKKVRQITALNELEIGATIASSEGNPEVESLKPALQHASLAS